MTETTNLSPATLAAVFEYAEIEVSPTRLAEKSDEYCSLLEFIHAASIEGLAETVPATAFKASWE